MVVATTDNKLLKKISLYQVCGDVHQVNKKHYDSVKRWLSSHMTECLCLQINVPLYFANEIVEMFCDETEYGLVIKEKNFPETIE